MISYIGLYTYYVLPTVTLVNAGKGVCRSGQCLWLLVCRICAQRSARSAIPAIPLAEVMIALDGLYALPELEHAR